MAAVPVSAEGALLIDFPVRHRGKRVRDSERSVTVQYISPGSLEPFSMGEMWDKVLVDGREDEVVDALQILEPQLANIYFLSGERAMRFGGRGGVLVGFEGIKQRVPLGSHGDGMRCLLALSLSLIEAKGGVLLLDEIDTGLHWSVMGDMWHLVVKAAQQSNVQIFATTHSLDCVRGLAWLCENHPDLGSEISLQKIDRNHDESVALDAEQIRISVEQAIEVR